MRCVLFAVVPINHRRGSFSNFTFPFCIRPLSLVGFPRYRSSLLRGSSTNTKLQQGLFGRTVTYPKAVDPSHVTKENCEEANRAAAQGVGGWKNGQAQGGNSDPQAILGLAMLHLVEPPLPAEHLTPPPDLDHFRSTPLLPSSPSSSFEEEEERDEKKEAAARSSSSSSSLAERKKRELAAMVRLPLPQCFEKRFATLYSGEERLPDPRRVRLRMRC